MALIIPPGFAAVSIPITNPAITRSAAVTFGIENEVFADPDQVAGDIQAVFVSTLGATVDSSCTIGPTRVAIGQDGGEPILGFASSTAPGGRALDSTAPILAALLTKRTMRGGRRGRGAMYLPWALADNVVNEGGVVAGAQVTVLQDAANDLLDDLAVANYPMVLLHSEGLTDPGDPNVVTAMQMQPIISHQVRRQVR